MRCVALRCAELRCVALRRFATLCHLQLYSPSPHSPATPTTTTASTTVPGETALAFFRAKNNSEKDITGVATYNVTPIRAGVYFHKIQCFCFEEQRLEAGEEVDMPVFFYVDPDILDDPLMRSVSTLTLSYTFFPSNSDEEEEAAAEEAAAAAVA